MTHTTMSPFGPVDDVAWLVLSHCWADVVIDVYPVGVAPLEPDDAGLLPDAACAYEAWATSFHQSDRPVDGLLPIFTVRFDMFVVPVTVTAIAKFLIHEKFVPVVVGILIGVVEVAESARLKVHPVSTFAQETDAPVPIWACVVAAPIVR
jgi:hypothetical protein